MNGHDSALIFIQQIRQAVADARSVLNREDMTAPLRALGEAGGPCLKQVRTELDEAHAILLEDADLRAAFGRGLAASGASGLMTAQAAVTKAAPGPKQAGASLSQALDWAAVGLEKALEYLPEGPLQSILKDILILLPAIKDLLGLESNELETISDGIAELEAKLLRFLHQVVGNPLVEDDTKKGAERIPPVAGPPDEPTLPGSLLWFLWDIERKLEHIWRRLEGTSYPRGGQNGLIIETRLDPEHDPPITKEIDRLIKLVECLTKLLGRTLYNADWRCEGTQVHPLNPPEGELHPVDSGTGRRGPQDTPPKSIKDELHDIQDAIERIRRPPPPPEEPPEDPQPAADLKRIFVYEQGIFQAAGPSDEKVIDVHSAAFDLAGWIDLSDLADGDGVLVQMFVHLAGGVRRLYRELAFAGLGDAGLKSLHDIFGPGCVAGDRIEIVIRHDTSASGFATPLDIAYQVVVESQRLRA